MEPKPSRELLRRWLLAAACGAVLLFFFSPAWSLFRLWSRVPDLPASFAVRRGVSVLQQMADPGAPLADPLHAAIQWRLLFPLVGRILHLSPAMLFSLADVGCLLVLGFIVGLLRRIGLAWAECAFATLLLGAASWFFTSTGWLGYYDSWLALALLAVAFAERRWVVALACLGAPWVDERFVIAAPLALLCREAWSLAREGSSATIASVGGRSVARDRFDWRREGAVPAVLLAGFVVVRLFVLSDRSGTGATVGGYFHGKRYLDAPMPVLALGVWEGLRAGWFFVAAAVVLLWRRRRGAGVFLGGAVLAIAIVGLATAQDYSRSMTMVFPAAVLGVLLTARAGVNWLPRGVRCGAVIALMLPAHHVMNDSVNPIYYLYHELAALRSPPRAAMPELYELRAIHDMERGDHAGAYANLTLAIELSDNPASPSRQRGILCASQGRWADALRDFSTAVDHDPENPDAWFMRAQANAAVGNLVAAHTDITHALSLAPEGWSSRPEVTRFLAKLNRTP
jgi:hypothetical protein